MQSVLYWIESFFSSHLLYISENFQLLAFSCNLNITVLLTWFIEQFAPGSLSEVLITSADSRIRVIDGTELVHKFKGKSCINSFLFTFFFGPSEVAVSLVIIHKSVYVRVIMDVLALR